MPRHHDIAGDRVRSSISTKDYILEVHPNPDGTSNFNVINLHTSKSNTEKLDNDRAALAHLVSYLATKLGKDLVDASIQLYTQLESCIPVHSTPASPAKPKVHIPSAHKALDEYRESTKNPDAIDYQSLYELIQRRDHPPFKRIAAKLAIAKIGYELSVELFLALLAHHEGLPLEASDHIDAALTRYLRIYSLYSEDL